MGLQLLPWAGAAGGFEPEGGGGYVDDDIDIKPPPKRTWLWLLIFLLLAGAGAAGGWYLYQKQVAEDAITSLLEQAPSMEPTERAAAYRKVLDSSVHDSFRMTAATKLGEMGDSEAIPLLMKVIDDPEELAQTAAVALGRMADNGNLAEGDQALAREKIFPQMQQAQSMGRTNFAFALALLHDERCIEPLLQGYIEDEQARSIEGLDAHLIAQFASPQKMIELTLSDDPAVKMFAARALGEKNADQGADALVNLLGDSNPSVVRSAAESLAKVAPTRAGPELIKLMQKQPDMQSALVVALRDSVGAPGLQPIYENTEDWEFKLRLIQHVRAPPPPGRQQPSDVPRGIGDPRAGDMCHHFYNNYTGPQIKREMGLWCLEELGDRRAAEGLFKIGQEDFSPERDSIIDDSLKSIGNLKLPGATEYFLDLLKQGKGRPATILGGLGRVGDASIGSKIEPFTRCPEADVLSGGACDRETALRVLGRISWPGALKLMVETAERHRDDKVATRIESRDIWQEFRLRDRIAALEGLAHLGDPEAADILMTTMEDTEDDPQIRLEAARALAYSANEEVVNTILTKIRDTDLDQETRKYYIAALWHHPTQAAVDDMVNFIADESTPNPLLLAAGFAIGEAGEDMVDQSRLRELLNQESSEHLVPACLAALMAGDEETISQLLQVFQTRQGIEDQVRDRYAGPQGHAVYLTPQMFEDGRIYRRLRNAHQLREASQSDHGWAWQHLTERLLNGTVNNPNGMSPYEIREALAEGVRNSEDREDQHIAALTLLRMGYRGYVLMLAAEEGPSAEVARRVLVGR